MQYGYFDDKNCEYVITNVNTPVSWTNYLGTGETGTVINQTAGGYMFHQSPENHRVTRFRPNSVPLDRPGHYVYLKDKENSDYWSVSWQPVGKPLDEAKYVCRHGLSYTTYESSYKGIIASETLFIPLNETNEVWAVEVTNKSDKPRKLSLYGYCEFSFNIVEIDNQNFQMSMYCSGSSFDSGVIECDNFYNPDMYHFFTSSFDADSYDCVRDLFIGPYRTETNPLGIEKDFLSNSTELGNNHCGALHKDFTLEPNQTKCFAFVLGVGNKEVGKKAKEKYSDYEVVKTELAKLASNWKEKLNRIQVNTPDKEMNSMLNVWNLYQAQTNIVFSRFASFIEVGGRTGLGYRDTAQDAMCACSIDSQKCKNRIVQLLRGLTSTGYGLHLFDPNLFDPDRPKTKPFVSPTVKPEPEPSSAVHGLKHTCSDDALWLVPSICEYIKETGDFEFLDTILGYCDGGDGTVYEHMKKILDFSNEQVAENGICKGLRADWNDCLNLGGGQSALVSFLHYWALSAFIDLATFLKKEEDVNHYTSIKERVTIACDKNLWDGEWFIRGFTKNGVKIGTHTDEEGKLHLESNAWAILSGYAKNENAQKALASMDKYLYSKYGLHLNTPSYSKPNDDIGFITRVYKGLKENGAIFSHSNPWVWSAACSLGEGNLAKKYYDSLCPAKQNDEIEIRQSEPYVYCQFIMGKDHTAFGRARHPWLTGSGGWSFFSATHDMLGIKPDYDKLVIDPCIDDSWESFTAQRIFREALYNIKVTNPHHVQKGVKTIKFNGQVVSYIPIAKPGSVNEVEVIMG